MAARATDAGYRHNNTEAGMKVVIEKGEYRGNATISIRKDTVELDKYPFTFGIAKAKLLLWALQQEPDFLEKFVREGE
jgi:hypothetical protein